MNQASPILLTVDEETAVLIRAHAQMTRQYGLDTSTVTALISVTGSAASALQLLKDGYPCEYILAMGETR